MRKYKFIALALVLAVMLMGAGYAYWTETLTISNTVSTGDLDVRFAPKVIHGDYDRHLNLDNFFRNIWSLYEDQKIDEGKFMDVSIDPSDDFKKLSFTVTDIYPGAGGFLHFVLVNTGTVPATLTDIQANTNFANNTEGLKDAFDYTIHKLRLVKTLKLFGIPFEYVDVVSQPIACESFDDFVNELRDIMSGYTLEPGWSWELNTGDVLAEIGGYSIELPASVEDYEDGQFRFDLSLNFQQGE